MVAFGSAAALCNDNPGGYPDLLEGLHPSNFLLRFALYKVRLQIWN